MYAKDIPGNNLAEHLVPFATVSPDAIKARLFAEVASKHAVFPGFGRAHVPLDADRQQCETYFDLKVHRAVIARNK
ncbi:hypothetical protein NL529_30540, partial [Klebsiella pneumoniae]|nr:hypothetical protein [Klebsiella pneumoniae]